MSSPVAAEVMSAAGASASAAELAGVDQFGEGLELAVVGVALMELIAGVVLVALIARVANALVTRRN